MAKPGAGGRLGFPPEHSLTFLLDSCLEKHSFSSRLSVPLLSSEDWAMAQAQPTPDEQKINRSDRERHFCFRK